MAWWRVSTSRRPDREGHSPKGTQHQISPVSPKTRTEGRAVSAPGRRHNGTVRCRPQHPCMHAHYFCLVYAILVLHYSVIRSITVRAHHPHQGLDPKVPRTYSCRQPADQLVSARQTGEARRHARKSKAKQALFRAAHKSWGDGQWWTHSWAVVVTRRRVRLRLRLQPASASCVCVFHHTPHP